MPAPKRRNKSPFIFCLRHRVDRLLAVSCALSTLPSRSLHYGRHIGSVTAIQQLSHSIVVRVDRLDSLSVTFERTTFIGPLEDRVFQVVNVLSAGSDQALSKFPRAITHCTISNNRPIRRQSAQRFG